MSQPRVKWGQTKRYFERRGYEIVGRGGDKVIRAPKGAAIHSRNFVVVGHKWCGSPNAELLPAYVKSIQRAFGVTAQQIVTD